MGHKAKWEYFRAVYERYRQAGREAKQVMLNEFCMTTGYTVSRPWLEHMEVKCESEVENNR